MSTHIYNANICRQMYCCILRRKFYEHNIAILKRFLCHSACGWAKSQHIWIRMQSNVCMCVQQMQTNNFISILEYQCIQMHIDLYLLCNCSYLIVCRSVNVCVCLCISVDLTHILNVSHRFGTRDYMTFECVIEHVRFIISHSFTQKCMPQTMAER